MDYNSWRSLPLYTPIGPSALIKCQHNVSKEPWPRFNIKMSYQYRKYYFGDKTLSSSQWEFLYWKDYIVVLNHSPPTHTHSTHPSTRPHPTPPHSHSHPPPPSTTPPTPPYPNPPPHSSFTYRFCGCWIVEALKKRKKNCYRLIGIFWFSIPNVGSTFLWQSPKRHVMIICRHNFGSEVHWTQIRVSPRYDLSNQLTPNILSFSLRSG